jgi:hypothetical protein
MKNHASAVDINENKRIDLYRLSRMIRETGDVNLLLNISKQNMIRDGVIGHSGSLTRSPAADAESIAVSRLCASVKYAVSKAANADERTERCGVAKGSICTRWTAKRVPASKRGVFCMCRQSGCGDGASEYLIQ